MWYLVVLAVVVFSMILRAMNSNKQPAIALATSRVSQQAMLTVASESNESSEAVETSEVAASPNETVASETMGSSESTESTTPETERNTNAQADAYIAETSKRMKEILIQMGCQPVVNPDHSIDVEYQGVSLCFMFGRDHVRVVDLFWSTIHKDNPSWPLLMQAINETNISNFPTLYYSRPSEEGIIALSTRSIFLLHPDNPDNLDYVRFHLGTFFDIRAYLQQQFMDLEMQQRQQPRSHRPVGFAPDPQEEVA